MDNKEILESRYLETSKLRLSNIFQNCSIQKRKDIFLYIKNNLQEIRNNNNIFTQLYDSFKESILSEVNITMGKIASAHYKLAQKKIKIQQQLEKSKKNQHHIEAQVVHLRQIIEDFIKQHNEEISNKDKKINQLTEILNKHSIKIQSREQTKVMKLFEELDPILEQQEQTVSNQTSNYETMRSFPLNNSQSGNRSPKSKQKSKRAKLFIEDFRRSIEGSHLVNNKNEFKNKNDQKQILNVQNEGIKIQLNDKENILSGSSSSNELTILGDTANVNVPLKCQSPKNIMFIKKNSKRIFHEARIHTQQQEVEKQNIEYTPTINMKQISRPSSQQKSQIARVSISSGNSETKRNISKEKIKVTCKMVNEFNLRPRTRNKKHNSSVHLGSKNYIAKLKNSIKLALEKYQLIVFPNQQQLKYEGSIVNNKKTGYGRLLYRNGLIYEGMLYNNLKHGFGKLIIGDNVIFEGQWQKDEINGKGQIKKLKQMSINCPQILLEASYVGQLKNNRFHGNGTLSISNKQKIMTKFNNGKPQGQFTLHTENSLDFGVWKE